MICIDVTYLATAPVGLRAGKRIHCPLLVHLISVGTKSMRSRLKKVRIYDLPQSLTQLVPRF